MYILHTSFHTTKLHTQQLFLTSNILYFSILHYLNRELKKIYGLLLWIRFDTLTVTVHLFSLP
jgi:hypothetical protein